MASIARIFLIGILIIIGIALVIGAIDLATFDDIDEIPSTVPSDNLMIVSCPTGFSLSHLDVFGENTFDAIPICVDNSGFGFLRCGDSGVVCSTTSTPDLMSLEADCPIGFVDVHSGSLVTLEELLSDDLVACRNLNGETFTCGLNEINTEGDSIFIECRVDGIATILP